MVMEVLHLKVGKQLYLEDTCVALGYFDGLHIGHLELLHQVQEFAEKNNFKKALMTFDIHPRSYLLEQEFCYLSSLEDKVDILEKYQFDYLLIIDFNEEFSRLSARDFIEQYIVNQNIKCVVCGFDYRFGSSGSGHPDTLKKLANNRYQTIIIEEKKEQGKKISSTYIRELLMLGNVEQVAKILCRPYIIKGAVVHGREIGRTIGFATANIEYGQYVLPKKGVYGVKVHCKGNEYIGMANIGYNPTFGDLSKPSLEVHIFDFDADIYGEVIGASFYVHIRDEVKFASKEELIHQLQQDQIAIKKYFKK